VIKISQPWIHMTIWTSFTSSIQLLYLVKVQTPKVHVNTTSAFNVNHKIAITCIKLHWQFHEMFWCIINEHSFQSMCSKCPPPACTHDLKTVMPLVNRSIKSFLSTSNRVCIKRFCRSSISWIIVSYTNCCITPKGSKFKAHDDPGPLWWSCNTFDAILFRNLSV